MNGVLRLASRVVGTLGAIIALVILMAAMAPDMHFFAFVDLTLILFLAVLVHEIGHATIGAMVGMKVRVFTVYPFELSVTPIHVRWVKRRDRHKLGGFVIFDDAASSVRARTAMIAAGPLANVLLAAIGGVGMAVAPWPSSVAGVSGAIFWVSGSMAVANLLPHGASDGAKLFAMARALPMRRRAEIEQ